MFMKNTQSFFKNSNFAQFSASNIQIYSKFTLFPTYCENKSLPKYRQGSHMKGNGL